MPLKFSKKTKYQLKNYRPIKLVFTRLETVDKLNINFNPALVLIGFWTPRHRMTNNTVAMVTSPPFLFPSNVLHMNRPQVTPDR